MENFIYETNVGKFEVEVLPQIVVNNELEWNITYTAGEIGVKAGGSIKIVVPAYQHQRTEEYIQAYDYWKPNYIYAIGEDDSIKVDTEIKKIPTAFEHIKKWPDSSRIAIIKLKNGLKTNEKINIKFAGIDRPWLEGESVPTKVSQFSFKKMGTYLKYQVAIDINGNGDYEEVDVFPQIKIIPSDAKKIILTAPTQVNKKEEFEIKVNVVDRFNNPLFDYNKENIILKIIDLKKDIEVAKITNEKDEYKATIFENGFYEVIASRDGLLIEKAVIMCVDSEEKIYWGDIHNHSNLTANIRDNDCEASPKAGYVYAKEVSYLDYICISEQTFEFNEDRSVNVNKATWQKIGEEADKQYEEGKLVTFPGFELHSMRGDTVVLCRDDLKNYQYPTEDVKDIPDVWKYYKDKEFLTIPHFHRYCGGRPSKDQQEQKYTGFDLKNWEHSSENERLAEVFSSQWGRFEYEGNPMILKARANVKGNTIIDFLNRGKKWGITASSDGHDGKPGYGAITGVYANIQTREGIFAGLKARKTIASTHPRIGIEFSVNGYNLGNIVSCEMEKQKEIEIKAVAPKIISYIEIIKNGEVLKREKVGKQWIEMKFIDDEMLTKDTYYYIRIKQEDGHMAWASPVWFVV